jgi:hypothetical protein
MPVAIKGPATRLALPAAGLLLAAASVYSAHQQAPVWVLARAVPAGSSLSPSDFRQVAQVATAGPPAHAVARVNLEPGQTVVGADFRSTARGAAPGATVSVALNSVALAGITAGDRVQFAVVGRQGPWISPPVVVTALVAGTYGGAGSVTLTAPMTVLTALVQHNLGSASVINLGPTP